MTHFRSDQIYHFLEGGLSDAERRDIERHAAECPACRQALDDRKVLEKAWTTLPPIDVPPDFAAAVMRRIKSKSRSPFWTWVLAAVAALTSLSVVIVGALGIAGKAQVSLVTGLNRSLIAFFSHSVILSVKFVKAAAAILNIAGDLTTRFLSSLSNLVLSFSDEIAALAALTLILSGLLAYGLHKRFLPGE